jgi:hypothetical protein
MPKNQDQQKIKLKKQIAETLAQIEAEKRYIQYLNDRVNDLFAWLSAMANTNLAQYSAHVLFTYFTQALIIPKSLALLFIEISAVSYIPSIAENYTKPFVKYYLPNGIINCSSDRAAIQAALDNDDIDCLTAQLDAWQTFGNRLSTAIETLQYIPGIPTLYFIWSQQKYENIFEHLYAIANNPPQRLILQAGIVFYGFANKKDFTKQELITRHNKLLQQTRSLVNIFNNAVSVKAETSADLRKNYLKISFPNEKFLHLQNQKTPLATKEIMDCLIHIFKKLGFEILISKAHILALSGHKINPDSTWEEQAQNAKALLKENLDKIIVLNNNLQKNLAELNQLTTAINRLGWTYHKIYHNNTPTIKFILYVYTASEKELLSEVLTKLYPNQVTELEYGFTIINYEKPDKALFDEALIKLVNCRSEDKIPTLPSRQTQTTYIQSAPTPKQTTIFPEWLRCMSNIFSTGNSNTSVQQSIQNTTQNNSSIHSKPAPKMWEDTYLEHQYKINPNNFKRLENYGNGKVYAFFHPKLRKKLSEQYELFKSTFEKNFIGTGYVENEEGHVQKEDGTFELKKLGHCGKNRPFGTFREIHPDGTACVVYKGLRKH